MANDQKGMEAARQMLGQRGIWLAPDSLSAIITAYLAASTPAKPVGELVERAEVNRILQGAFGDDTAALLDKITTLAAERDSWRRVAERCKYEAEGHAQEARTANSTIYAIYQAISGAKDEPGNWHGAQPVIEYIAASQAQVATLTAALERIAFDGISDREKLTASALDYVNHGGEWPNERTIAAVALAALNPKPSEPT